MPILKSAILSFKFEVLATFSETVQSENPEHVKYMQYTVYLKCLCEHFLKTIRDSLRILSRASQEQDSHCHCKTK